MAQAPRPDIALQARAAAQWTAAAHRSAGCVIDEYSTSFATATRLLGGPVRPRVRAMYAMVRVADEIVDGAGAGAGLDEAGVREALDDYEARCEAALATGFSPDPVLHAFADAALATGTGTELTRPFFDSMRADLEQSVHDPQSFAAYVYGSAEVVGLMCLNAFVTDRSPTPVTPAPHLVDGARRLGAAFQKVNFLRDLADDADARGRAYFPGVDPDALTDADRDRLVADIRADLAAADAVVPELPASSRAAVAAAHDLFAALTDRLAVTPAARLRTTRVRVPDWRKGLIVAGAVHRTRSRVPPMRVLQRPASRLPRPRRRSA